MITFQALRKTLALTIGVIAALAIFQSTARAGSPSNFTPVEQLYQYDSGPGIIVGEPIASTALGVGGRSSTLADFGRGCSAWLELALGGHPEFGRTPTIAELTRAMREMGRSDLALTGPDAASLWHITGATDIAAGTIDGSMDRCTLAYEIYTAPQCQARGNLITASGPPADVARQLPRVERELAHVLRGSSTSTPIDLTVDDLVLIGSLWEVEDASFVTEDEFTGISRLAARSPLAAIVYLRLLGGSSHTQSRRAVSAIYKRAGGNVMAVEAAAMLAPDEIALHAARIDANRKAHPRNYLAALASTWLARARNDQAATRIASEAAARCAPNDPYSWETLSETVSDAAIDLRHARPVSSLSRHDRAQLVNLYLLGADCLQRSVNIDPIDGSAWLHLSIAAAFSGDTTLAEHAYENAVRCKVDSYAAYSWAFQMYGKRWFDDPSRLSAVIAQIHSADFANESETIAMASDLRGAGFGDDANKLLGGAIAATQYTLSGNPSNGYTHRRLAAYYRAVGNIGAAIDEYLTAEKYIENRPDLYFTSGLALDAAGRYRDAAVEYRNAVGLDPDFDAAHACLAQDLMETGGLKEAAVEIDRALQLAPNSPAAHYGRGRLCYARNNPHAGDVEYRKAINLSGGSIDMYYQICWTLDAAGHYTSCIHYGREALRLHPRTLSIMDQMADSFLGNRDTRSGIQMLESVLTINPTDSWAHEKLGEAYEQTGDRGSARKEWQTVIALGDQTIGRRAQQMLDKYPP